MTVYVDSSALLARHLAGPARQAILAAMDEDDQWCTSAMSLTEAIAAIDRIVEGELLRQDFEDLVRRDVERMYIVPVDQRCLDRAARLARDQPVHLVDALHLAAADRLPRPLVYLTVDAAQIRSRALARLRRPPQLTPRWRCVERTQGSTHR
ncbi:MAG: type II toxin-antitoxin system VapC family toxin [Ilumatobacteraceae bacterium]